MKLYSESPGASMRMAESPRLCQVLQDLVMAERITHVLESGTFRGLGSTTRVAERRGQA